ncbi:MAG: endolytic transglycosylase MltG [bacterium]|nr:endolytic transglycosylase MltG [bacterium]
MNLMKKTLILLSLLVLAILIGTWLEMNLAYDNASTEEKLFSVEEGQGLFAIAKNLKKENLVRQEWFFDIVVFLEGGARKLQAGDYRFSQAMTPREMAKKIISGDIARQTITIPEGWNMREIGQYLELTGLMPAADFIRAADEDFSKEFLFLADKPKTASLEGYLFPDTYELKIGEETNILVRKMLVNFDEKLTPEIRSKIKSQGKTIFDIVTIASLLEEEVKTLEDKKIVSGILWKRLKTGMRLQVDATIVYALGALAPGPTRSGIRALGKSPGKLTYDDLKTDSFYNTYRYAGLPPGPIANPGLESIKAAIYPKQSSYWYYLSAPDGTTYFSQTLEEHNLNKVKYLK